MLAYFVVLLLFILFIQKPQINIECAYVFNMDSWLCQAVLIKCNLSAEGSCESHREQINRFMNTMHTQTNSTIFWIPKMVATTLCFDLVPQRLFSSIYIPFLLCNHRQDAFSCSLLKSDWTIMQFINPNTVLFTKLVWFCSFSSYIFFHQARSHVPYFWCDDSLQKGEDKK